MQQPGFFDNIYCVIGLLLVLAAARCLLGAGKKPTARQESDWRKFTVETLDSLLIALALVFFIIRPFIVQAFWIPTPSMTNTLVTNDRILVSKFLYRLRPPCRGEIVVFDAPPAAAQGEAKEFVKRVIGLPGDVVEVKEGKVHLNSKPLDEPYVREMPIRYNMKIIGGQVYYINHYNRSQVMQDTTAVTDRTPSWFEQAKPEAVPPGMLFVMGDNRNESSDSHIWGFLPMKNLQGKAFAIFFPLNRVGLLEQSAAYADVKK